MSTNQPKSRPFVEKLMKWRAVLAGWQLGSRSSTDPECEAVRDHRESSLALRIELNALLQVLIDKGVMTFEEFDDQLALEAQVLDHEYEKLFPGFQSTATGMSINPKVAAETMKNWRK